MKRVLCFLSATVFALSMISCNQEEMDNLQKQIDELKDTKIQIVMKTKVIILVALLDVISVSCGN